MKITKTNLPGVVVIASECFFDTRGFFIEAYVSKTYQAAFKHRPFVQDNLSVSRAGVLRGLHYQLSQPPQAKLVRVFSGRILDVVVDIRLGSPTFAEWTAVELSAANGRALYLPGGFAHGYYTIEDASVFYKCDAYYAPEHEYGIRWDDKTIGIQWPQSSPLLSRRDQGLPCLLTRGLSLPRYTGPQDAEATISKLIRAS